MPLPEFFKKEVGVEFTPEERIEFEEGDFLIFGLPPGDKSSKKEMTDFGKYLSEKKSHLNVKFPHLSADALTRKGIDTVIPEGDNTAMQFSVGVSAESGAYVIRNFSGEKDLYVSVLVSAGWSLIKIPPGKSTEDAMKNLNLEGADLLKKQLKERNPESFRILYPLDGTDVKEASYFAVVKTVASTKKDAEGNVVSSVFEYLVVDKDEESLDVDRRVDPFQKSTLSRQHVND